MRKAHPPCSECKREPWKGHWPWCSKAPIEVHERYEDRRQRLEYRRAVAELGCVCPNTLGPGVHLSACPYGQEHRSLTDWKDHLDQEHEDAHG